MLTNIWSWGGSSSATAASNTKDYETDVSTIETEDDIADKLLSQFPPYGTNEPNLDNWMGEEGHKEEVKGRSAADKYANANQQHHAPKSPNSDSVSSAPKASHFWDPREESLWKGSTNNSTTAAVTSTTTLDSPTRTTTTSSSLSSPTKSNSIITKSATTSTTTQKEYWMPDQLCKQCYDCDAPFTVFRRRHHCRLCGQVFCSTCSAYFVDDSSRACRECFAQYNTRSSLENFAAADNDTAAAATQYLPQHKEQPSMLLESPSSAKQQQQQLEQEAQAVVVRRSSNTITTNNKPETATTTNNKSPKSPSKDSSNLGLTAATHLERLGRTLLTTEAPLLWKDVSSPNGRHEWIQQLMRLATQACATVNPNVKNGGDSLDLRPYVKIKSIAGGSLHDCAYLSGVMFRKSVVHKRMAKELTNPRILLLSGGIEFTRGEGAHRMASLEILLEQEDKYTEILVGKILKLSPDLVLVGRCVSRKAQELLLKANVVLLQHVKPQLLQRIARQTGATIISSTDHVMNQFGTKVLGKCLRFRLVSFRDNEVWMDAEMNNNARPGKSIPALLSEPNLPNHERQAALAAAQLGQDVLDGAQAVKIGLAKRGVALSFVMLEGCPPSLGCTIVLRGASTAALKQVKKVLRFLVNVAHNLRLETSYLRERCAQIPTRFHVQARHLFSSSLCVDYGSPPRQKLKPWNGGSQQDSLSSSSTSVTTAMDHQSILITSVWMTEKTQCCPAQVKGICYYSLQDVALGQFLRDSCFNLSLKCQNPNCKKSVLDHTLSFVHNDGLINISVEHMDDPLPPAPLEGNIVEETDDPEVDSPIATWTYCTKCKKYVTPLVHISEDTWKFSFGKFLETFFYNRDAVLNAGPCCCNMQSSSVLYFGCGRLAARFAYERIKPFGVYVGRQLPIDESFHQSEAIRQLEQISVASSELFVKFDKHIEKVSREARSLFGSAVNRPEHLQTVLSQLNMIGSEVDHAAKTLQEKIASVSDKCQSSAVVQEALFRFPWYSRRYLFMLTCAWNERLSAAGQALAAMRKLADSRSRGDIVGVDGNEDLMEGMRRLRMLNEVYSKYNMTDISIMLPINLPSQQQQQRRSRTPRHDDDDADDGDEFDSPPSDYPPLDPPSAPTMDNVDADVMASRKRFYGRDARSSRRRSALAAEQDQTLQDKNKNTTTSNNNSKHGVVTTPGGAVKSAITRFFNRGGKDVDPYEVDLGIFKEGRPRLEPGVDGIVIPVFDEIPSTVIAYSLSSVEYQKQMVQFSKMESKSDTADGRPPPLPDSKPAELRPDDKRAPPGIGGVQEERKDIERRMLERNKSHIKHTFRDCDDKGQQTCKFVCTTYWATQFKAVRQAFLAPKAENSSLDVEKCYIQSLAAAYSWAASGGKSGASFHRTADDRFVIKCISRTELQMFLDCAPAYFEYLSKAFFHGLPTVLCKIVGVYQIGYHNRETGKRSMDQIAVMQNIFYDRKISKTFDLKGSLRGRFARHNKAAEAAEPSEANATVHNKKTGDAATSGSDDDNDEDNDHQSTSVPDYSRAGDAANSGGNSTLLDGDFLEFTNGRPLPLNDRAKAVFHMSILNDTLFLSIINVLDYSILVGIDEEKMELVVGIIDFMRQYDIMKQMERVGKSLPMVVGSEAPTIIQPPLYKARFTNAMERYFMKVPSKWSTI